MKVLELKGDYRQINFNDLIITIQKPDIKKPCACCGEIKKPKYLVSWKQDSKHYNRFAIACNLECAVFWNEPHHEAIIMDYKELIENI